MKAVSDVYRAAVRRDRRGQRGPRDAPERINDDPYGEAGWSRSGCPTRAKPRQLWTRRPTRRLAASEPLHQSPTTTAARCSRPIGVERSRTCSPTSRRAAAGPRAGSPAGHVRAGGLRAPARARRAQHVGRRRAQLPRRRDVRPLRARADRPDHQALGVPDPVHAVPARDLAGQAAGDVRVPDRDLELTGLPVSNASVYEGPSAVGAAAISRASRDRQSGSLSRAAFTRTRETLRTKAAGWGMTIEVALGTAPPTPMRSRGSRRRHGRGLRAAAQLLRRGRRPRAAGAAARTGAVLLCRATR